MCGIVGYIGKKDATPIILEGLKKLEYRGYDSAGIAVLENGKITVRRDSGKIAHLGELIASSPISGSPGIGHTRWATHGAPSERNAHPHVGFNGQVVLVHNGIVENYLELKDELVNEGIQFNSETDTETIVHLIESYLAAGLDLKNGSAENAGTHSRRAWHCRILNPGTRKNHRRTHGERRRRGDWAGCWRELHRV